MPRNLDITRTFGIAMVLLAVLPPADGATDMNGIETKQTGDRLLVTHGELEAGFGLSGKREGQVTSIHYRGRSYLGDGQSAYIRSFGMPMKNGEPTIGPKEAKGLRHAWTCRTIVEDGYTEVRFSETTTEKWPMSTDIGWVFRKEDPGLYYYLCYHHPGNMPDVKLSQTRMSIRVPTNTFQKAYIDEGRIYDVIPIGKWTGHRKIMDATYWLEHGRIVTKYSWITRKENQRFYGYAGRGTGIFHHFPSMEHVNGGPNKQSNTIHHTPKGPIVLNVMSSGHFGAGGTLVQGEWTKLYGPFYLSFTTEDTWQENVQATKKRQLELEKEWPLRWFRHPRYVQGRGIAKGIIRINSRPAANALVLLGTQKAENMSATLNHGLGYMYWSRTDANGRFCIPSIVPGNYCLYVHQPDVFGDFHSPLDSPYRVTSDGVTQIGELSFSEETFGEKLWQIGIPDRDSTEFRGAQNNEFRPYGGLCRLKDTFDGDNPVFKVGESDPPKDFYYAHPVFLATLDEYTDLALDAPGADHSSFIQVPERVIEFDLPTPPQGEYLLTIALASARRAKLNLFLNNTMVADLKVPTEDSGAIRSGSCGLPSERKVKLPVKLLKRGKNRLMIRHTRGLALRENPSPHETNRKVESGIIYPEDPSANLRRHLKGPIFAAILYDAIKLEQKTREAHGQDTGQGNGRQMTKGIRE